MFRKPLSLITKITGLARDIDISAIPAGVGYYASAGMKFANGLVTANPALAEMVQSQLLPLFTMISATANTGANAISMLDLSAAISALRDNDALSSLSMKDKVAIVLLAAAGAGFTGFSAYETMTEDADMMAYKGYSSSLGSLFFTSAKHYAMYKAQKNTMIAEALDEDEVQALRPV